MVRKFFVFSFFYIVYMLFVFGGLALVWKYSFEAGLTKYTLTSVAMLLLLMVFVGVPPVWFSYTNGRLSGAQKRVMQTGQEASAQILQVEDTGLSLGNSHLSTVVRLTLWVSPTEGKPFQAQIETPISRATFPQTGQTVRVKFDAKHRERVVLTDAS